LQRFDESVNFDIRITQRLHMEIHYLITTLKLLVLLNRLIAREVLIYWVHTLSDIITSNFDFIWRENEYD
jgi:hypothetical protein